MDTQRLKAGYLCLTDVCNNRCEWCYAKSSGYHGKHMPLSLAKNAIELFAASDVDNITLLGGEPTLYENLFQVVEFSFENNLHPTIISNGRRFSDVDFSQKLADLGIEVVTISAKAANRKQYKQITHADGYDEMMDGFTNLKKLGVKVPFTITLVNEVARSVNEFLGNLLEAGVDRITVNMAGPIFVNGEVVVDSIPDPQKATDLLIQAYDFLKDKGVQYNFFVSTPLCLFPEQILRDLLAEKRIISCCHARTGYATTFDYSGNVLFCNHFGDYPVARYGEDFLNHADFAKFWFGNKMAKFREKLTRYPSVLCENCELWEMCGGGCFINWTYWDPAKIIRRFEDE